MKVKYLFLFVVAFSVFACSSDSDSSQKSSKESKEKNDSDSDNPYAQLQKAAESITGEKKETVDFEDLEALLPEKLNGFEREEVEGSKSGMMGFSVSTSTAEYRKGDQKIEIVLVDTGGLGIGAALASWTKMEYSKKDKNGFERTAEFKGHKSFEQFRKNGKSEFAYFYNDRYLVTASGRVDDFDDLKDMVGDLKLKKLPE